MKVKNHQQLEALKLRLRVQELEHEKMIHKNWSELKEMFTPAQIIKNIFHKGNKKGWLHAAVEETVKKATGKTIETIEEKVETKITDGINKLISKIENKFKN